ncbi:hypothetical protein ES703_90873 [subsurface metagenome]|jgi:hypothetical protein
MRRNLFLYLTIACFIGLIAIFVVDGYLGIYDTVYITTGEQSFKVEADVWQRQWPTYAPVPIYEEPMLAEGGKGAYYMPANREEKISFRYEVDNRVFSTYKADIEVSVWHSQQKVRDLILQPMSISAFDKGESEWVIDNTELLPKDILPEQSYDYTVIIKRGEIERRIVVSINPVGYPRKY